MHWAGASAHNTKEWKWEWKQGGRNACMHANGHTPRVWIVEELGDTVSQVLETVLVGMNRAVFRQKPDEGRGAGAA